MAGGRSGSGIALKPDIWLSVETAVLAAARGDTTTSRSTLFGVERDIETFYIYVDYLLQAALRRTRFGPKPTVEQIGTLASEAGLRLQLLGRFDPEVTLQTLLIAANHPTGKPPLGGGTYVVYACTVMPSLVAEPRIFLEEMKPQVAEYVRRLLLRDPKEFSYLKR